jgi:hypothetical protein
MNTSNNSLNRLQTLKSQGPFNCGCGKIVEDSVLQEYLIIFSDTDIKQQTAKTHQMLCEDCHRMIEWQYEKQMKKAGVKRI